METQCSTGEQILFKGHECVFLFFFYSFSSSLQLTNHSPTTWSKRQAKKWRCDCAVDWVRKKTPNSPLTLVTFLFFSTFSTRKKSRVTNNNLICMRHLLFLNIPEFLKHRPSICFVDQNSVGCGMNLVNIFTDLCYLKNRMSIWRTYEFYGFFKLYFEKEELCLYANVRRDKTPCFSSRTALSCVIPKEDAQLAIADAERLFERSTKKLPSNILYSFEEENIFFGRHLNDGWSLYEANGRTVLFQMIWIR